MTVSTHAQCSRIRRVFVAHLFASSGVDCQLRHDFRAQIERKFGEKQEQNEEAGHDRDCNQPPSASFLSLHSGGSSPLARFSLVAPENVRTRKSSSVFGYASRRFSREVNDELIVFLVFF
jgi:hypothetical protein